MGSKVRRCTQSHRQLSSWAGVRPRSGPASRRCLDQAWNNICETPGLWGERPRASLTKETREAGGREQNPGGVTQSPEGWGQGRRGQRPTPSPTPALARRGGNGTGRGGGGPFMTQPRSWDTGSEGFLGKSWDMGTCWPLTTLRPTGEAWAEVLLSVTESKLQTHQE